MRRVFTTPHIAVVLAAVLIGVFAAGTIDNARARDKALRQAQLSSLIALNAATSSSSQIAQLQSHVTDLRNQVDAETAALATADAQRRAEAADASTQIDALKNQLRQLGAKPVIVTVPSRTVVVPGPPVTVVVPAPPTTAPAHPTTTTTTALKKQSTTTTTIKRT